jgi:hypothetical protein
MPQMEISDLQGTNYIVLVKEFIFDTVLFGDDTGLKINYPITYFRF